MRKLSVLLCLGVVLCAAPAFGDRSTDRKSKVRGEFTGSKVALDAVPDGGVATGFGTAYANMAYLGGTGCAAGYCISDDYDSINDKPIDLYSVRWIGGVANAGDVVFFEVWDSTLTTPYAYIGYSLPAGYYFWTFGPFASGTFTAPDQGWVQMYFLPNTGDGSGAVFVGGHTPTVGTEDPNVGGYTYGETNYALMFQLNNPPLQGTCCVALTGNCSFTVEADCAPPNVWTADPDGVLTCDPNPCPAGSCGNGVLQEEFGEQCDDGNTIPGDGCDQNCQEELTFVPAVSEWGLLVMALLGLTVGTVLFGRRRATA